ncbi:unnamed protein product [Lactuca saligna]|uniref:Uncharacterized protein n=1 Tax=Lactuca saligna TaxID=75948 RepID=A0AA35ZK49_LACSI|nr:unnamed protein product [Lactuca saligna]
MFPPSLLEPTVSISSLTILTCITEGFGKTITPYEDLSNRVDLSCPKIGILTSRKTRVNEELQVAIDGRVLKIGIIEFDEDWFPFRFDKSEDYYETQDEDDEEDNEYGNEEEDGISDTYMGNLDDEKEEGEISPELQTEKNVIQSEGGQAINTEIGDEFPTRQPVVRSKVNETSEEVQRTLGEQMMVRDSMLTEHVASPRILEALMDNGNIPSLIHNSKDNCPGLGMESNPNLNGLSYELPPIGCFGPFSSPIVSNKGIRQSSEVCSSLGKRWRLEHDEPRRPILLINPMTGLFDLDVPPSHMASQTAVVKEVDHAPIDINIVPSESHGNLNEDVSDDFSSSSTEIRKTVEIGNALGFEISPNDPILKGVMGEIGEAAAPQ